MQNDKEEKFSFVNDVDDNVSTDSITELKSGIFNLFVNLYDHLSIDIGPRDAIIESTNYLLYIVDTFKQALENENQE
jgi:hypothetical protein